MLKLKNYYKPTPKKWRKIGDALLGVSMLSVPSELAEYSAIAISLFVLGVVGKFLTNFFSDDNDETIN